MNKDLSSLEQIKEDISDVSKEIEHIYTSLNESNITSNDKYYYQKKLELLKNELTELKEDKIDMEKQLLENK